MSFFNKCSKCFGRAFIGYIVSLEKEIKPKKCSSEHTLNSTKCLVTFCNVSLHTLSTLVIILLFIMSSPFPRLYKGSAGYCSMYRGEVCHGLLRRSALVFFNSSLPDPEQAQEFLAHGGWAELEGTSPLCQPAARSLLCHAAFQDCSPSDLGPAPKPVCRYTTESLGYSLLFTSIAFRKSVKTMRIS